LSDDPLWILLQKIHRSELGRGRALDSRGAPPIEEAAPEAQAATEPPATEAPLPEAVVVEGEFSS
jgi:hypothetical protein